jgi:hypothetical protein
MNGRGRWGVKIKTPTTISANDTDAQAFITAAGITDTTQQSAINTLVTTLKGYGVWSKMKAIYPFVGGTANAHKFNLKDSRDSNAAFRLQFNGGWTHSSTGAKPNGTNAYTDTFLNPSTSLTNNNYHLSHYSRTQKPTSTEVDIASMNGGASVTAIALDQYYAGAGKAFVAGDYNTSVIVNADTNTLGMLVGSRTSQTSAKMFMNNVQKGSTLTLSNPNTLPNVTIFIGANHSGVSILEFSSKECAFASIGDGLTDTEVANFYTAVQTFQTTLGRQVGVPIVADTDAQAFLNAAVITNTTQASAVNTLVTSLKSYGIWSKLKAIYPFVGGTANAHKFNLKDSRDADVAFRLGFFGGWTHTSTGAKPNGTTAYADTFLNTATVIGNANDGHLTYYSRTNNSGINQIEIGNRDSHSSFDLVIKFGAGNLAGACINMSDTNTFSNTTSSTGFYHANQNNTANVRKMFKNGAILATQTVAQNVQPSEKVFIGARGGVSSGFFSNRECAFASVGNGLTDAEAANYYAAVQAFQTTLGRQI